MVPYAPLATFHRRSPSFLQTPSALHCGAHYSDQCRASKPKSFNSQMVGFATA